MNTHPAIRSHPDQFICPSKYYFKKHKSMDQKVFKGYNLAWLQKKGHFWDNWIQMAKHKGTFLLFTFKR